MRVKQRKLRTIRFFADTKAEQDQIVKTAKEAICSLRKKQALSEIRAHVYQSLAWFAASKIVWTKKLGSEEDKKI